MAKSKKYVWFVTVLSIVLLIAGTTFEKAEAKTIKLSITTVLAEGAAQSKGMRAWMKAVEEKSNGQVKFGQLTYAGAILKPTHLLEGIRDRVVDVGFISSVYHPTKTPLSNSLQPVFLGDFRGAADVQTELYNTIPQIRDEWLKWDVVPIAWYSGANVVHMSNFEFDTMEDIKAKKIRAIGKVMPLAVKRWGAIPVALGAQDCYTGLQKGMIDDVLFPEYALMSNKIAEVIKQVTDWRYGGWCMWFGIGMNADVWNSLPDDVKKAFIEAAPVASEFERKANYDDAMAGFKLARQHGVRLVQFSQEESLKWQKVADPPSIWEEGIKTAEKAGHKNARELFEKALKLVKDYEAQNPHKTLMEQFFELEKAGN